MPWLEWIASRHPLLVHVPVAAALLVPLALLASQRPGRGIRPWWTTSRYLGWCGWLGGIASLGSGYLLARASELLPPGILLVPRTMPQLMDLRLHQLWALGSLGAGLLMLLAISRRRQDHQGIGVLGLLAGCLWAGATVVTGMYGGRLTRPDTKTLVAQAATPNVPAPVVPAPEPAKPASEVPAWMLDYASLEAQHAEPVKSPMHGNRWIRVWVNREAGEAYRAGQPLPAGSRVVMSSSDDKWGRPAFGIGPIYALEISASGKPVLSYYWAKVPEALRGETNGADRAFMQGSHPGLQSCLECHAQGAAPMNQRSQWHIPRKPKAEEAGSRPEAATP